MVQVINQTMRRVPAWGVYGLLTVPAIWLIWRALTGGLGVDPVKALEHGLGEIALQLVIAGLAITPLRRLTGISLLKFRRAVGLMTFFYVVLHLLVWLVLDVQILSQVWADIVKRPYITVGMAAFVLMVPLALTSNDWSVRKLRSAWRRLHKLAYAAAILGALHFVMLAKGFQLEPLLYLGAIVALLALRLRLPGRSGVPSAG
jgi:sulfoxide reductase heme-binding subunit YedZ